MKHQVVMETMTLEVDIGVRIYVSGVRLDIVSQRPSMAHLR
jgi:hypothetical protein